MTVTQLTFNTLAFANRLKSAGLDPIIAEAQADAQAELLKEAADNNFVTKQDLHEAKHDLETKIELLESRLTIKLGGIMLAGTGLLATLLTIFHAH